MWNNFLSLPIQRNMGAYVITLVLAIRRILMNVQHIGLGIEIKMWVKKMFDIYTYLVPSHTAPTGIQSDPSKIDPHFIRNLTFFLRQSNSLM